MIEITDIHLSFGDIHAVAGISLNVSPGEVFGLLGPNGAGKSTVINMMTGLLSPDSGTVRINGKHDPRDHHTRTIMGVAPQALALYDELTGAENLLFFGKLFGLSGSKLNKRVDELLAITGLTEAGSRRVGGYSGGMKRRLNIAAALVQQPMLLLLDEPTAGVDPQSRAAIFELVETLKHQSVCIIYTTHYMEEAQRLCDRVGIIDRGKLLALDTVSKLIDTHGGRVVVRVERNGDEQAISTDEPVEEIRKQLSDGSVDGLRIDRPNLEAVFLNLTGRSLRD